MTAREWVSEISTLIIALMVVGTCCGIVVGQAFEGHAVQAITLPPFLDTALGFVIAFFFNRQATAQVVQLANGKLETLATQLALVQSALPPAPPPQPKAA